MRLLFFIGVFVVGLAAFFWQAEIDRRKDIEAVQAIPRESELADASKWDTKVTEGGVLYSRRTNSGTGPLIQVVTGGGEATNQPVDVITEFDRKLLTTATNLYQNGFLDGLSYGLRKAQDRRPFTNNVSEHYFRYGVDQHMENVEAKFSEAKPTVEVTP
jgi:hypothetical protein